MTEYTVVYEWAGNNYSAYVPDLPGCITTGKTLEETERLIREAVQLYIDVLIEDGKAIPAPTTTAVMVAITTVRRDV